MIRRLFWFILGACSALFVTSWTKKKANEMAGKLTFENIARTSATHVLSAARSAVEVAKHTWSRLRASDDQTVIQSPNP